MKITKKNTIMLGNRYNNCFNDVKLPMSSIISKISNINQKIRNTNELNRNNLNMLFDGEFNCNINRISSYHKVVYFINKHVVAKFANSKIIQIELEIAKIMGKFYADIIWHDTNVILQERGIKFFKGDISEAKAIAKKNNIIDVNYGNVMLFNNGYKLIDASYSRTYLKKREQL